MNDTTDMIDLQLEDVEDYSADYPQNDIGYPNAEANMAPGANLDDGVKTSPKYRQGALIALLKNNKWAFAVFAVGMIALIGVLAVSVGNTSAQRPMNAKTFDDDGFDFDVGVPPPKVNADAVNKDVLAVFKNTLENTFDRNALDKSILEKEGSPQRNAMIWMCEDKNVNEIEHTELLQRYVLATLFYSTNMVPSMHVQDPKAWKVADNWMTNAHSCDWMGVQCNEDKVITAIYLEKNRLSGKIPLDFKLIANRIETLDFTDNMIHMRDADFNAFQPFKNLKTLLMDDNYLYNDDGLPPQFSALTNLRKLRLSYNVFEGEMDKHAVLGSMTKLTHLEIESNYFNGTMPSAVANLEELTYLYMRRNSMRFNLDFIKYGSFRQNIFAMWLDGNDVFGTIPTQIGLMAGLASISIANSTLTGTIPTEMGSLHQLERLWLFDNQLTGSIPFTLNNLPKLEVGEFHDNQLKGTMPKGICSAVDKSDYKFKSLTSDCLSKVACSDCCTKCY